MTPTRRGARAGAAMATALLAVLPAACTASPPAAEPRPDSTASPAAGASPSGAPTLTVRSRPLELRLTAVRGPLPAQARARVRGQLRRALGAWMDGAYVGGGHPRTDFSAAYGSYTPRAGAQARRQRTVTTNQALGGELVEVVPTRRRARVSVLAHRGRAVGASAQVLVVLVGLRDDESQVEAVVRGDLSLTPTPDGWKVFAFDLARSVGAPGTYVAAQRKERARDRRDGRPDGGAR